MELIVEEAEEPGPLRLTSVWMVETHIIVCSGLLKESLLDKLSRNTRGSRVMTTVDCA